MWDVHYDRLSINLIAIMGDDVIEMGPMPRDDEELITTIYSKKTGRRKFDHFLSRLYRLVGALRCWLRGANVP